MKRYIFPFIMLSLIISFVPIDLVLAETGESFIYSNLILNEIMPNPEGSDTDYEWIEIRNNSNYEIDLSECNIDEKDFDESQFIGRNDYIIITRDLEDKDDDDQSFEKRWGNGSGVWGDDVKESFKAIDLTISLKNTDDEVVLVCGEYKEVFSWEKSISGASFSLTNQEEWSNEYMITPGYENKPHPLKEYSDKLKISEVYPSPSREDDDIEWLEIFNDDKKSVDLIGWKIEDNTKTFTIKKSIEIKSKEHYVITEEDFTITLNNSGEKLKIIDPNGYVVDLFEYESTDNGISNIKKWENGKYTKRIFQTRINTPGKRNVFIDIDDVFYGEEINSIKNFKQLDDGTYGVISGYITVQINLLGAKIFYIEDISSGIQVYLYDENIWKKFSLGDKIKVFGEKKVSYGEERIYVKEDYYIQKLHSNSIKPSIVEVEEIDNSYMGQLVLISGRIVETSGQSFFVGEEEENVKILIKASTGIETPEKHKGQYALITGIVSKYGNSEDSIRILPRFNDDIIISDNELDAGDVLAVTGGNISDVYIIAIILLGLIRLLNIAQKITSKSL